MSDYGLLINGAIVPGADSMDVVNPATEQVIAASPRASLEQLEAAVAAAKAAFPAWSGADMAKRQAVIAAMATAISDHAEELARLLTLEQGKPLTEARMEVAGASAMLQYFSTVTLAPKVIEDSERRLVELHRRPLGVVAAIVPWNFPLLILIGKIGPALAVGNTVVAKPAPTTPLTALRFAQLVANIVPAGVLNIIADANDLGAALSSHPDVRKVTFTGSTATGAKVMAGAAQSLKRVTLELGGNDAGLVLDDADVEAIAAHLFGVAFVNNGQVCVAVKRLYVHDSLYDKMCDALARLADAAVVGDGLDEGTQLGPLQNKAQLARIEELVEDARNHGRIIAGGTRLNRPGYFFRPTIVRDIAAGTRLVDEEQFGPVLPLIRYSDSDAAVAEINRSPYGLGSSVWSSDPARAAEIARRIDAGTVWVNQHLDSMPYIPFGGAKASGIGTEFGEEGLAEYTQIHVVNIAR